MKFTELELHPKLLGNLAKINFSECTPIQEQAIPVLLQGRDVAGLAQTGTGKTAAFLLPLIDRVLRSLEKDPNPRAFKEWKKRNCLLVLVPTRELADQVLENALKLIPDTGLSAVAIYGGTTYDKQKAALNKGVEIVIATPGRLIDLYKEHVFDMGQVRAIVFDEADRMFDMGFKDDMKFILRRVPKERQFLVFSATLNFDVLNVAYEFGADPVEINISRDQAKAEHVKDVIFHVGHTDKPSYLLSLLKKEEPQQAIIFSNFKRNVERIALFLNRNGYPAVAISSLLTQGQRNRVMTQFRASNDRNILVATDLAARGLDIIGVDMVINFELPDDPENYVHRIGRTGRAGKEGQAFSLVSDRDVEALSRIESYLKHKVEVVWIDDQDLQTEFTPFPSEDETSNGPRAPKGQRFDNKRRDFKRGGQDKGPRRHPKNSDSRRPPREGSRDGGSRDTLRDSPRDPARESNHRNGGEQKSAHRDRRTGRHQSHPQSEPRGEPRRNQQHRRGQHGNGPRRPPSTSHNSKSAPQKNSSGVVGKVSGFIKRLFSKKAPAKPSTRNS